MKGPLSVAADDEIVKCAACGAKNRVAADRIQHDLQPICGECGAALTMHAHPVAVSDQTFERDVLQSKLPVLVDLWAPWCGPCRTIAPTLEAVAQEKAGRLRVAKVNVDENPITADRLGVQGIPTMILFKDGSEVDRIVGAVSKSTLLRRLAAVA
jgi:thioredoxin 2